MRQERIPAQERREAILKAVRCLFAEKGCAGVTTKELAKAAGVSEALIYLHFPSKESLYAALAESCVLGADAEEYKRILTLEPSASTLVALTHFIAAKKLLSPSKEKKSGDILAVRSLLDNGDYIRAIHEKLGSAWHDKFTESLNAAIEAGEAQRVLSSDELAPWIAISTAFGLMLHLLPADPIVKVKLSRAEMVERCVWSTLLGIGVKAETIRKYYNPKALALMAAA